MDKEREEIAWKVKSLADEIEARNDGAKIFELLNIILAESLNTRDREEDESLDFLCDYENVALKSIAAKIVSKKALINRITEEPLFKEGIEELYEFELTKSDIQTLVNLKNPFLLSTLLFTHLTKEDIINNISLFNNIERKEFKKVMESINFNETEIEIMLNNGSYIFREYAYKIASKKLLLELAKKSDIVECVWILSNLDISSLSNYEMEYLADANCLEIRGAIAKHCCIDTLLKMAKNSDEEEIIDIICERLESITLTQSQCDQLLETKTSKLWKYGLVNPSKEKIIEFVINADYAERELATQVINKLEEYQLSYLEITNILCKSKWTDVIIYSIKNINFGGLLAFIHSENYYTSYFDKYVNEALSNFELSEDLLLFFAKSDKGVLNYHFLLRYNSKEAISYTTDFEGLANMYKNVLENTDLARTFISKVLE